MRYSSTLEPDGVGEGHYDGCGDLARFFLRAARFQTWRCGPTITAARACLERRN